MKDVFSWFFFRILLGFPRRYLFLAHPINFEIWNRLFSYNFMNILVTFSLSSLPSRELLSYKTVSLLFFWFQESLWLIDWEESSISSGRLFNDFKQDAKLKKRKGFIHHLYDILELPWRFWRLKDLSLWGFAFFGMLGSVCSQKLVLRTACFQLIPFGRIFLHSGAWNLFLLGIQTSLGLPF